MASGTVRHGPAILIRSPALLVAASSMAPAWSLPPSAMARRPRSNSFGVMLARSGVRPTPRSASVRVARTWGSASSKSTIHNTGCGSEPVTGWMIRAACRPFAEIAPPRINPPSWRVSQCALAGSPVGPGCEAQAGLRPVFPHLDRTSLRKPACAARRLPGGASRRGPAIVRGCCLAAVAAER